MTDGPQKVVAQVVHCDQTGDKTINLVELPLGDSPEVSPPYQVMDSKGYLSIL